MDDVNTRTVIGDNKPPIAEQMKENHKDLFAKLDELAAADALVPAVIENDDDEGKAQDLFVQCQRAVKTAVAMHKLEKEPYDKTIKELKATFAIPSEKVEKAANTIKGRVDAYKEKKRQAELKRLAAEAEARRQEAERLQREADEQERLRKEAEQKRIDEERKAREAQAMREKAEADAKAARERAEELRQQQARLEKEAKERAEKEERDRKERAAKEAEDEIERKKQDAIRDAEKKAHEERMAKLREEREAEEKKALEAREASAKALAERRDAENAASAAKKEERVAGRAADASADDASRMEKKADKIDNVMKGSESELTRGRGEYGSVGSRVSRWTYQVLDRDKIPLEALRPFLNPDHVDAAITRFLAANRSELGTGRDKDDLLPGVEFYKETDTRIV